MPPHQQQQQQETVSDSDSDNQEECIICANPITWYAVGPCNHRTCHVCALRLRALYKNTNCTYCKAEQPSVVFTAHPSKLFDDYTRQELQHHDEKTKIYFDNKEIYEGTMIFLLFNCPDDKCDVSCRGGWSELKTHVKTVHNRLLCDLCTRFKKVFYHEHTLFTPVELDRHLRGEDYLNETQMCGFKGHPKCGFCKIGFYGADELFEHCKKTHEQCFLCQRMGVDGARDQFYANYDTLEKHFNSDHILCEDKACLAHKFVVFATDIDFKAHLREKHPRYCVNQRQRSEQRRAMQVQVNFTYAGGQDQTKGRERRFGNEENNAPMRSEFNQPARRRSGSGNPDVFTLPGRGPVAQMSNNGMNPGRKQNAKRAPDGFGEFSIVGQPQSLSQGSLPQQTVQSISTRQRQQEYWPGLGEATGVVNITKSSKNATSRKSPPGSGRLLDNESVVANSQTQEFSEVVKSDTVWDGKKLQLEGYPTLKASDTAVSAAPAKLNTRKVLVIKSRESSSARWGTGGRETWDRIAKAASSTLITSPLQQPPQSPVAMATPYNSKSSTQPKAWTGSSLLLTSPAPLPVSPAPAIQTRSHPNQKPARPEAFPSLPRAATPTYPTWGKKKGTGSMASSAWCAPRSGESNDQEEEDMQLALALSLSDVHIDSSAARKKNAKKKKVLLHFG